MDWVTGQNLARFFLVTGGSWVVEVHLHIPLCFTIVSNFHTMQLPWVVCMVMTVDSREHANY